MRLRELPNVEVVTHDSFMQWGPGISCRGVDVIIYFISSLTASRNPQLAVGYKFSLLLMALASLPTVKKSCFFSTLPNPAA